MVMTFWVANFTLCPICNSYIPSSYHRKSGFVIVLRKSQGKNENMSAVNDKKEKRTKVREKMT